VATRRYEQKLRAESAAETRQKIVGALADQLRRAPSEPITVEAIARRARVSRSTVYGIFGSRSGLVDAFVDDLWARTGMARLTEAVHSPDAREHLRGGIAAAARMYDGDRDVYRVLFSLGRLDPAADGGALRKMENERAGGMAHLANRLAEDGVLRPGVSVRQAADTLWVLCGFHAYDTLRTDRGLSMEEAVGVLVTTAERSLCA
jgi:AcrR family transcriptional regulator